MRNVLVSKLEHFGALGKDDERALDAMIANSRSVPRRSYLSRDGDVADTIHVVLSGFLTRSRGLSSGDRQIFGYLLPGDVAGLNTFVAKRIAYDIVALTDCVVADVHPQVLLNAMERHPRIARALWWQSLAIEAVLREWIINLALRKSGERLAHLLCELMVRLERVGLVNDGTYELPLTQQDLGDTLALTAIHVNRSLRELREAGLVTMKGGKVFIGNTERLKRFAGFDDAYLRFERGKIAS
jgi:CRP-like cAMP-binding protein